MSLSQLPDQLRARLPAHLGTSLHANTNRRRSQPYCGVYIAITKIATRIENTRDHNAGSNHIVFGNLTNTRFSSCKSLIRRKRISHLKKMMLVLWVSRACGRLHRYYCYHWQGGVGLMPTDRSIHAKKFESGVHCTFHMHRHNRHVLPSLETPTNQRARYGGSSVHHSASARLFCARFSGQL